VRAQLIAHPQQLRVLLRSLLLDQSYSRLDAAVAFVRLSGMQAIENELTQFAQRASVRILVGLDFKMSSHEAIARLHTIAGADTDIYGMRSGDAECFHPKMYLFTGAKTAALVVGSANLTGTALGTNEEATLALQLDLGEEGDKRLVDEATKRIDDWCSGHRPSATLLTAKSLAMMVASGSILAEEAILSKRSSDADAPGPTNGPTEQQQGHLIEVYKTMWGRIDSIDNRDMSYIAVPPAVVALVVGWSSLMPQVDADKLVLRELYLTVATHMAVASQALVGVIALVLLRSYVDHARAISNIAAVESALSISQYIPRRLSSKNAASRGRLLKRMLRSSKGVLFLFYNFLVWGIACVLGGCGTYIAAGLVQAVLLAYVVYYAIVFPDEVASNRDAPTLR
jgi:HKD family nuclease